MDALADRDYFSDYSILRDPYSYLEATRSKGPVFEDPRNGTVYVTGFEEVLEVLRNNEDFSSVLTPQGPAMPLPFVPAGSEIGVQIEAHRNQFHGGDQVVSYDDKRHADSRSLLSCLFTPSRLKANEAFIAEYSDQIVRNAVGKGHCEIVREIAAPFVTLVIADLLGVPADDRQLFMDVIQAGTVPGSLNDEDRAVADHPLQVMAGYFIDYVQDRRAKPRKDVLSELANATFPDGTQPEAQEIVRLATFLFGAGQDTSAKLLGNAMRFIVEQEGLQQMLREDPRRVPALIEEVLRLEGSSKMTARLARKDTQIGGIKFPAGTRVMLSLAAANRDPARWNDPKALILDRSRIKEHLAFGRGSHVCIGAPLARVEIRVILEKFLMYTSHIDIAEVHGPAGDRDLEYEPSFIIRGLKEMHLTLTPAA